MSSSRHSIKPSSAATAPTSRPPCTLHTSAVISDKAQLFGTHAVEVGADCVVHPYAKLRAEGGRVVLGEGVLVSETAVIGLPAATRTPTTVTSSGEGNDGEHVTIEDGVSVESGAEVMASRIGEHSVIEVMAKVGRGAIVGKYCKVGPLCEIRPGETLPDYTVVFGSNQRRFDKSLAENREIAEARQKAHGMEIDLLKKLIPNAAEKWR